MAATGKGRGGVVADLVAKLPFTYAKDGISYNLLHRAGGASGKSPVSAGNNLVGLLDGYFHQ